jgi:CRISPR-associated endonuclease Cas1
MGKELAEQIYTRQTSDPRVCVVDGWGIKLTTERGQLVISDGLGATRRTRTLPRVDRTVRRIVITGREGSVTLSALRWCREHKIAVITTDPYGAMVAVSSPDDSPDAPTMRAQAFCGTGGPCESTGLDIAKLIIGRKLAGQAENCDVLGRDREAREIRRVSQFLDQAQTMQEVSRIEAEAGREYWSAWSEVTVAWNRGDIAKVPAHWTAYRGRNNPLTGTNQAMHPVNALLNYAYRMLEIETRLACLAAGLDPSLGFQHADRYDRDSLVADLMEAVRPEVDAWILGLLAHPGNQYPRRFSRSEFTEVSGRKDGPPAGTVRLVAPLTHVIAEHAVSWARSLYPVAEQIARMIAAATPGRMTARTITADKAIMAKRPASQRVEGICSEDVISDRVWDLVASLAEQLPYPATSTVARRDVIAALVYARTRRVRRSVVAGQFGMSEGVITRRWADWRDCDAYHKIEAVISEHAKRSPGGASHGLAS